MGATFGLTLPRWEETICVMIEKSPGNLALAQTAADFYHGK